MVDSGDAAESIASGIDGGGGHGLVGMRERAAMFGGTLTAQRREDRGFEVNAVLPYGQGRGAPPSTVAQGTQPPGGGTPWA